MRYFNIAGPCNREKHQKPTQCTVLYGAPTTEKKQHKPVSSSMICPKPENGLTDSG
jgi:hypothetical protein